MRLIDLSQPLYDGCPNCPSHDPVAIPTVTIHEQSGWQMEMLHCATHTGTHVDAPLHKISGGRSISDFPLVDWVNEAVPIDLRHLPSRAIIGADELQGAIRAELHGRVVLLATGWGQRRAHTDEWKLHAPRLGPGGAAWLVSQGVRGVGIDHYSIGGLEEPLNAETHTILLSSSVWILEDLVFPDEIFHLPLPLRLWSVPLLLRGGSGAPCRAFVQVL